MITGYSILNLKQKFVIVKFHQLSIKTNDLVDTGFLR